MCFNLTLLSLNAQHRGNLCKYPHKPYNAQDLSLRATFFVADSVGVALVSLAQLAQKALDEMTQNDSYYTVQVHQSLYQSKGAYDFLY